MTMPIELIDTSNTVLDIRSDWSVRQRARNPGPPARIDGMTVGVVAMNANERSPHNGEMHPDGDEILLITSGKIRISHDSGAEPLELSAGEGCIVRKGEWHKIDCLDDGQLIHITPGPNGEARFS